MGGGGVHGQQWVAAGCMARGAYRSSSSAAARQGRPPRRRPRGSGCIGTPCLRRREAHSGGSERGSAQR
eukprot:3611132-Prymnesium_polylepis.1